MVNQPWLTVKHPPSCLIIPTIHWDGGKEKIATTGTRKLKGQESGREITYQLESWEKQT